MQQQQHFWQAILHPILRMLMLVLVAAGLLLPRMSAVLVEVLPGVSSVVICTGDALEVWTIGPDGKPIEDLEPIQHDCVMTDVVTMTAVTAPLWLVLAGDFAHQFAVQENVVGSGSPYAPNRPTRGPPVLI